MVVYGVKPCTRSSPLTIQILAHERTAVVANYYSIRIEHRDDLDHVGISKELGFGIVTHQVVYYSLHYPRGIGLSWMHSGCQNHRLSDSNLFRQT
jgi:hypothetical protein